MNRQGRRSAISGGTPELRRELRRRLQPALARLAPGGEVSILLTGDAQIQKLNAQYAGLDEPTDVLSFPQNEPDGFKNPHPAILGDIVISLDTARRQAARTGHSLIDEVVLLAGHGLLHLLGHDHQTPEERQPFHQLSTELLGRRGV